MNSSSESQVNQDESQTNDLPSLAVFLEKLTICSNVVEEIKKKDEASMEIWSVALDDMTRSLEITWPLIEKENKRKLVAEALRAAQSSDVAVKKAGLYLMNEIIQLSHEIVDDCLDILMPIATDAIKSEVQSLQMAGIQLWRCVIEQEYPRDGHFNLDKDALVSEEDRCFVRKAFKHFPEFIIELLKAMEKAEPPSDIEASDSQEEQREDVETETKQNSDKNEEWSPRLLLVLCLHTVIENYPTLVYAYILPYVRNAIKDNTDLKKRFGAVYTLKRVAFDIRRDDAAVILKSFMPLIIAVTRDPDSLRLRSKALYLINVMLIQYPSLVPEGRELRLLLDNLLECRKDYLIWVNTPNGDQFRWRKKYLWRLNFFTTFNLLIHAAYDNAVKKADDDKRPQSFVLSPYYDKMVEDAINDSSQFRHTLELACNLLACTPEDCYSSMVDFTDSLLRHLREMIERSTSHHAACICHEVTQEILCSSLPDVMKAMKVGEKETIEFHNQFTTCLLEILENCCRDKKPVDKSVLKALSKMMPLLGRDGLKRFTYILVFHIDSILRLPTSEEAEKSTLIIISLIGDLFITLKSDASPYLNNMMKLLLDRKELTLPARIACVSALGKTAAGVGERFHPYLSDVLQLLQETSEFVSTSDKSEMDELLTTCFDTYANLIRWVFKRSDGKVSDQEAVATEKLLPLCYTSVSKLISFLEYIEASCETHTAGAHLVGNFLLKFETEGVLNGLDITGETCKTLLTEANSRESTSKVVQVVCSAALRIMEVTNGRNLN